MIIDSHCHAWEHWPYEPPVPDPDMRARPETLLFEMDQNGVDQAVLIAARIGDNLGNNDFGAAAAAAHPGRLIPFADVDSRWNVTYRTAGADGRLAEAADRFGLVGFTHYLAEEDDGSWLVSEDGRRLFGLAEARGLIASLSILPAQMPAVAALAALFPRLVILCHHMAFLGPRTAATEGAARMVVEAAGHPNIHIKISGFGNVAAPSMEYPYSKLTWIVRLLHEIYGPWRLHWASDYPVSRRHMTYLQTLDMLRRHGGLPNAAVETILGPSFARVLEDRRPGG